MEAYIGALREVSDVLPLDAHTTAFLNADADAAELPPIPSRKPSSSSCAAVRQYQVATQFAAEEIKGLMSGMGDVNGNGHHLPNGNLRNGHQSSSEPEEPAPPPITDAPSEEDDFSDAKDVRPNQPHRIVHSAETTDGLRTWIRVMDRRRRQQKSSHRPSLRLPAPPMMGPTTLSPGCSTVLFLKATEMVTDLEHTGSQRLQNDPRPFIRLRTRRNWLRILSARRHPLPPTSFRHP